MRLSYLRPRAGNGIRHVMAPVDDNHADSSEMHADSSEMHADSSEMIAREATPSELPSVTAQQPVVAARDSSADEEKETPPEQATQVSSVKGSPLRALGVILVLIAGAGGIGTGIQFAQFFGGEVGAAQVLRVDETEVQDGTRYRYLVQVDRQNGESTEGYLDSREKLSLKQRITVTYLPGARRELVIGDGAQQRFLLKAFGVLGLFGIMLAVLARRRVKA